MHVPFIAGLSHIIIVQHDVELLHALVLACGTIQFDNVSKSCPSPLCLNVEESDKNSFTAHEFRYKKLAVKNCAR
jgi:hypothetical protein